MQADKAQEIQTSDVNEALGHVATEEASCDPSAPPSFVLELDAVYKTLERRFAHFGDMFPQAVAAEPSYEAADEPAYAAAAELFAGLPAPESIAPAAPESIAPAAPESIAPAAPESIAPAAPESIAPVVMTASWPSVDFEPELEVVPEPPPRRRLGWVVGSVVMASVAILGVALLQLGLRGDSGPPAVSLAARIQTTESRVFAKSAEVPATKASAVVAVPSASSATVRPRVNAPPARGAPPGAGACGKNAVNVGGKCQPLNNRSKESTKTGPRP